MIIYRLLNEIKMYNRIKTIPKKPEINRKNLLSQKKKTSSYSPNSPLDQILFLQRSIGNQAVERMVRNVHCP